VKTIETVSVMALTADDGLEVLRLIAGYDPTHPFSRPDADGVDLRMPDPPSRFTVGIPKGEGLRFFGDSAAEAMFAQAIRRLEGMGGTVEEVDFTPFEEAQRILYDGPWIAERALTLDDVVAKHGAALHPVTRQILQSAGGHSAKDAFRAIHRIAELRMITRPVLKRLHALMVPTTPTIYRKAEIEADPIALNSRLGIYTNFVNLMGLSGIAVPNGFRPDGLPLGVTFLGPGFAEARLAALGGAYQRELGGKMGATQHPVPR
jgi:allophanate hydrolase